MSTGRAGKAKEKKGEPGAVSEAAVVGLLEHPRAERRSAAAIILAELAPESEETLAGLRHAVRRTDDPTLRRWAAEALGAIGPKSIVGDLQPLLKDPDRIVRETVERVLSTSKGVKASEIARMLEGSDEKERVAAIAVLGAMGGADARRRLLAQLFGASSRITNALVDALRPGLLKAQGAEAEKALVDIEAILLPERIVQDPDFAIAALQLVGYVADASAVSVLLKIAESAAQPEVRGAAIETLRKAIKTKKADQRIFKFLLDCVERASEPHAVVQPALDTLAGLELPLALEPRVRALLEAKDAHVRRWAMRALSDLDTAPAAKALGKIVETGDPADREAALEAAKRTASGRAELARLLGRTHEEGRARNIAHALRSSGEELEQGTRKLLEDLVVEAPAGTGEVIIELLRHVGGKSAEKVQDSLQEKAMRLKKKGQWADAIALLRPIAHGPSAEPELRYQLGVCELKASKKALGRGPTGDPVFATFNALARARDFPMIERLKEEKVLEPEDLYFLGFSFAEGNEQEQAIGGDVLSLLVESTPRSQLGKMAKNKLRTMGWEE